MSQTWIRKTALTLSATTAVVALTAMPASAATGGLHPDIKDGSAAAAIGCSIANTFFDGCSCGLDVDYALAHCDIHGNYHDHKADTDAANAKG